MMWLALLLLLFPQTQQATAQLSITVTGHSVTLNWVASTSPGVTSYNVYRGSVSKGPYTKLASVPVLNYTDLSVKSGERWYYVVSAVGPPCPTTITATTPPCGESVYSNEAAATIPSAAGCLTSGATTWTSVPTTTQTGIATSKQFTIQPTAPATNGGPVVGLSQNAISSATYQYGQNATLIRQSDNGFWELFSQATSGYAHDVAVQWVVGTPTTFTWSVDIPNQRASLVLFQAGNCVNGCAIASNYQFRVASSSIGFLNLDNTSTPLIVCNFAM